MNMIMSIK